MRIYDLHDDQGHLHAFEVQNVLLGRSRACKIAQSLPGAQIMKKPKMFGGTDDFCLFEVNGEAFVISEPFGDNSRYWVGPRHPSKSQTLWAIRSQFAAYESWRRPMILLVVTALVAGGIVTFVHVSRLIQQDKCLDSGNRWNHEQVICER